MRSKKQPEPGRFCGQWPLPKGSPSIARTLQRKGYLELPGNQNAETPSQYAPELIAERALDFIRKNQAQHDFLFWDFAGDGGQIAVRMGPWKGIRRKVVKNTDAPWELYNLEQDIGEQNNIAAQHPDVVQQIEQIIARERTRSEVARFRFSHTLP